MAGRGIGANRGRGAIAGTLYGNYRRGIAGFPTGTRFPDCISLEFAGLSLVYVSRRRDGGSPRGLLSVSRACPGVWPDVQAGQCMRR